MRLGAIILCGGQSRRMGQPKWALPFGKENLLQCIYRRVAAQVDEVVVALSPDQPDLLPLADVKWVRDRQADCGPLEGLHAGLQYFTRNATECPEAIYVTACDMPLLQPGWIEELVYWMRRNPTAQLVLPCQGNQTHPLAALYRPDVAAAVQQLRQQGIRRLQAVLDACSVCRVEAQHLQRLDAELLSLRNVNDQDDYQQLLEREPR